jgi:hypothetical protein
MAWRWLYSHLHLLLHRCGGSYMTLGWSVLRPPSTRTDRLPRLPRLLTSPAHLAGSPRLLTSPAHLACPPRLLTCLLTSPAHLACSPRLPAHLACSPRLLTSPAHLACSPRLLTSPAHLACSPRAALAHARYPHTLAGDPPLTRRIWDIPNAPDLGHMGRSCWPDPCDPTRTQD